MHGGRPQRLQGKQTTASRNEPPNKKTETLAIMSTASPLIYAELLLNIRQVSVFAALQSSSDASTKVELSADGRRIALHHVGKTTVLSLPAKVIPSAKLQRAPSGSKELSWRLPLAAEVKRGDPDSDEAPWPAKGLGEDTEFRCRKCDAVVVKKGAITVWKDLPSENWAEMMDFWHCHKPEEHGKAGHTHGDDPNENKGYGANTKFMARSKVGFVDLSTLLVAEEDCTSIQVSDKLLIQNVSNLVFLKEFMRENGYQEGGLALH